MKIIFKKPIDQDNEFSNMDVTVVSHSEGLHEIIENFENFLRGLGFSIPPDVHLEFIQEQTMELDETEQ